MSENKGFIFGQENAEALFNAFSGVEEISTFIENFYALTKESAYINIQIADLQKIDLKNRDEQMQMLIVKQLVYVCLFFRAHFELIHDMMKCLDMKAIDLDEAEEKKKRGDLL